MTLTPHTTQPLEAGVEVWTSRGYGQIVCRFMSGDHNFPHPPAYVVELDDDLGRTVVMARDMQVVERVGS